MKKIYPLMLATSAMFWGCFDTATNADSIIVTPGTSGVLSSDSAIESSASVGSSASVESSTSVESSATAESGNPVSSSSVKIDVPYSSVDMTGFTGGSMLTGKMMSWFGSDYEPQITTGLDNGTETSGYWYYYTDADDGGKSTVTLPYVSSLDEDLVGALLDNCDGFCVDYALNKGELSSYNPYVGVGFNVAGQTNGEGPGLDYADASAWGGLCIRYTVDAPASLELSMGDQLDSQLGFDLPFVSLPKATTPTEKCFAWNKFKQYGWGGMNMTGDEAAKLLTSVKIRVQAADGTTGRLNVLGISSYFAKGQYVPGSSSSAKNSSSSVAKSSSSVAGAVSSSVQPISVGWNGSFGDYQIETGLDVGDGTSGYWFVYDDSMDGGKSSISWTVPLGNKNDINALDNVIDSCGGVCGTYTLDKGTLDYNPFVGVGFLMGGGVANGGDAQPVDARPWGGVCVTYTSDNPISLEMGFADEFEAYIRYDVPFVTMPKSLTVSSMCFEWSKFKQAGWGSKITVADGEPAARLASLKFKIQAASGNTGNFNISYVGSYGNPQHVNAR